MDLLPILKTIAPWIATAITGPLGGLAVGMACDALGVSDKTQKALEQSLSGITQEQLLALKVADQSFEIKMKELGFHNLETLEGIASEDRKDARAMQVAIRSWLPNALSILVTLGFFGVLIGLMMGVLTIAESPIAMLLIGSLATQWGTVMAFNFGTTVSNNRQTELLAKAEPIK